MAKNKQMKNPFNFFDKIFLINLDSRKDRLQKAINQFNEYKINKSITRFPAIKLIYENGINDKFLARSGCTLSHFEICKIAKQENLKNYLVLEDDFEFFHNPEKTLSILEKSIADLPNDWDMFYLGGNLTNEYGFNPIEKYSENLFKLKSCHTTHAMAFNAKFYDKFLDNAPDMNSIIDWTNKHEIIDVFLSKNILYKHECFISNELLILQSEGFSDIEKNEYDYRDWLINSFEKYKKSL